MVQERQASQDYFRTLLRTVIGQAFSAADYHFQESPLQWVGGKYRYLKSFEDGLFGLIDFQVLVYSETMWSTGAPSRFNVQLTRSPDRKGMQREHASYVSRGLSQLVVEDFDIKILPAADHWWTYQDTDSLGKALAEAGPLDRRLWHALVDR